MDQDVVTVTIDSIEQKRCRGYKDGVWLVRARDSRSGFTNYYDIQVIGIACYLKIGQQVRITFTKVALGHS
jgi:hypothetical protein